MPGVIKEMHKKKKKVTLYSDRSLVHNPQKRVCIVFGVHFLDSCTRDESCMVFTGVHLVDDCTRGESCMSSPCAVLLCYNWAQLPAVFTQVARVG